MRLEIHVIYTKHEHVYHNKVTHTAQNTHAKNNNTPKVWNWRRMQAADILPAANSKDIAVGLPRRISSPNSIKIDAAIVRTD